MSPDSPKPYRLILFQAARNQIEQCAREAIGQGGRDAFVALFSSVQWHLTNDPMSWGDPHFTYTHLGIQHFQRTIPPYTFRYGVDAIRQLVYLLTILP
jgi:hypothetical protein